MTVVCTRIYSDRIEIASDTQISRGSVWDKDDNPKKQFKDYSKIIEINGIVFWGAWYLEDILRLKSFCKTNNPKSAITDDIEDFFVKFYDYSKKINNEFKARSSFIFIYKSKVFLIMEYFVCEIEEYTSIWCWMYHSNTALYLWEDVKKAVEVSKHFAWGVGGETHFKSIKK